jgi:hypothetical protein
VSTIEQAANALRAAAATVEGLRVHPDVGPGVDPPAVVVGVPALEWEALCPGPTSAQFPVWVVVPNDLARADTRLYELVPLVAAALDEVPDATVVRADPGTYPSSGVDLPAYQITVDVALGA